MDMSDPLQVTELAVEYLFEFQVDFALEEVDMAVEGRGGPAEITGGEAVEEGATQHGESKGPLGQACSGATSHEASSSLTRNRTTALVSTSSGSATSSTSSV